LKIAGYVDTRQNHVKLRNGTIQALPLILGKSRKNDVQYLDVCRSKRNIVKYDQIGTVSEQDADELIEFCGELKEAVLAWLQKNHPELIE